jgi:hypothetical protein
MINHENVGMKRFLRFNTILCMYIYIYIVVTHQKMDID